MLVSIPLKWQEDVVWQCVIFRFFMSQARTATVLASLLRLCSQYVQLISFFISLKIIILLGSDNIPKVLNGFVTNENKGEWLIILGVAIPFLFLLSIYSDFKARRVVANKGKELCLKLNVEKKKTENFTELFNAFFDVNCQAYSALFRFLTGFFIILVLMPSVVLVLTLLMYLELQVLFFLRQSNNIY